MDKLPVILVVLDPNEIEAALSKLNFDAALVVAMLVEDGDRREIEVGDSSIPTYSLASIEDFLIKKTDFIWLIVAEHFEPIKNFLLANEIPEDFIVDFNGAIDPRWLESLQSLGDQNYFATGSELTLDGLDRDQILGASGVNLACRAQDLRQSLQTARYVFSRSQSIKFNFIGLSPHSLFFESTDQAQYIFALKNFKDTTVQGQLLEKFLMPTIKPSKEETATDFSPRALENWQETLDELSIEMRADVFNRNLDRLEQSIKLSLERGSKPIALILPYAPIIRQKYPREQLAIFRQAIKQLEAIYPELLTIDLFDLPLGYDCFKDMTRLNPRGAQLISSLINFKLHNQNVLPFAELAQSKYASLYGLSALLMMDSYLKLLNKIFGLTIDRLKRSEKIRVGFVLYDAAMWCGDLLYNLFAQSDRYEPTIFLCRRLDLDAELTEKDFEAGSKIFSSKGMNVVAAENFSRQDVLIYLTPYTDILPQPLQLEEQTAETLVCYIPYGMHISGDARVPLTEYPIMTLAWKVFLDTRNTLEFYDNGCRFGLPRGYYSGYPRMDYFFDDRSDQSDRFEWKEARPRSTKIIWAPHWSIDNGIQYSTFHLNCKFFYEYAKSHPKTSWVFKPHPNLAYSAVSSGLFRSLEDYEEYVRRWEKLPNARVVTGGWYQSIFASSDGMILDSGSFNAEYQYTQKPLLFLTRETQAFTSLGAELMKVLYRADGRDHKSISAFIENVLIKKRDSMAAARKNFFDEHFNYRRDNGMLASEFIFDEIDRELR